MIEHQTIFEELSENEKAWLHATGATKDLNAGDLVIAEESPLDEIYIVLKGRLNVRVKAVGDKPIAHIRPGEVVGEMSFLEGRPASATVEAEGEAQLLVLECDQLAEKLKEDLAFASHFYKALSLLATRRLRKTVEKLSLVIHGMSDDFAGGEGTDWTDLYMALEECKSLADNS